MNGPVVNVEKLYGWQTTAAQSGFLFFVPTPSQARRVRKGAIIRLNGMATQDYKITDVQRYKSVEDLIHRTNLAVYKVSENSIRLLENAAKGAEVFLVSLRKVEEKDEAAK
jgi:hypothetical protein